MRPWTRLECARQVKEAADRLAEETPDHEAERLDKALQQEFGEELVLLGGGDNAELRLESAYTRSTEIVGKPLTDGDHFGQTIINDYGGLSSRALTMCRGCLDGRHTGQLQFMCAASFSILPLRPLCH